MNPQDAQTSESKPEPTPDPQHDGIVKAIADLEREKAARKALEKELKEKASKEVELQTTLERYKSVDPDQYEKLIKAQAERDEKDLLARKEFAVLREQYRAEAEAAKKDANSWKGRYDELQIKTAVESAFFNNGGRKSSIDLSAQGVEAEDITPVEAVLSILKEKIQIQDGKIVLLNSVGSVELNSEGRPKTITEKILELKKGSMGTLFDPENTNSGSGMTPTTTYNGKMVKIFSRAQARQGAASIDDIADGKAFVN